MSENRSVYLFQLNSVLVASLRTLAEGFLVWLNVRDHLIQFYNSKSDGFINMQMM